MSDKKVSKELNLGLTSLLSQGRQGSGSAADSGAQATPCTSIVLVDEDVARLQPELARLAGSGQWHALVSRAESSITSEEDLEARLWWIRGHLGAFTLPVSLLAAPFEAVCRNLVGDARVEVYRGLLREIGEIMVARLGDVGDLRQEHSVRMALCQLRVLEPTTIVRGGAMTAPPYSPRLGGTLPGDRAPEVVNSKNVNGEMSQLGSFLRYLAVCVIVISISWLIFVGNYLRGAPVLTAVREGFLVVTPAPEMIPPQIEARPVSSSLEALYFSMEKSEAAKLQTLPNGRIARSRVGEDVPLLRRESRPPAPASPEAKERVKTDGPVEGPEFRRAIERGSIPVPRLPDPIPEVAVKPVPNQSYPDGSLNIGGDIKSALVRTEVFDSPSDHGRIIARLVPGDKVQVEARIGQWFRIRSRRGRVGFVFAPDIGEHEEFDVGAQQSTQDGAGLRLP